MTKNKIHNETIKLYEQLEYHKEEEFAGFVGETKEEIWHPKGWYYHGISFTSIITNLHNYESTQIFQEIAANIDLQKVKDHHYIRNILEDLNSKQIKKLNKEIKYWQDELVRLPAPIPIIENQIIYYTNALYKFNEWFSLVENKSISLRKDKHKKNYPTEAKLYLQIALEKFPNDPVLKNLEYASIKKLGEKISVSTWCRRLEDRKFLLELAGLISKKINKAKSLGNSIDEDKLENIRLHIIELANKLPPVRSQDIYEKRKKANSYEVDQLSSDN